jgi:hypothetical protein
MNTDVSPELLSDVNDLIKTIQKSQECNAECQRSRKEKQLFENIVEAKNNMKHGPLLIKEAEDKYYEFTQDTEYEKIKTKRVTEKVASEITKMRKDLNKELVELNTLADYSNALDGTIKNSDMMIKASDDTLKDMMDDVELVQQSKIANRKLEYIKKDAKLYTLLAKQMTYLFWILYAISLVIILIYRRKYTPYFVLFALLVWSFKYISRYAFSFVISIFDTILRVI